MNKSNLDLDPEDHLDNIRRQGAQRAGKNRTVRCTCVRRKGGTGAGVMGTVLSHRLKPQWELSNAHNDMSTSWSRKVWGYK